jgi:hemerythrin-like domain-containing protein
MKPTEELVHEHQVIVHVLKTATAEARRLRDGAAMRTALIEIMLDFFRNFTDKCHHAKEEKHLFPLLEKKGMAHDTGPIAVMLAEHTEGRKILTNIDGLLPAAKQDDKGAIKAIAENLQVLFYRG